MDILKLMKLAPAIEALVAALEGASSGSVDVPIKGVRIPGGIWDLEVRATRRPAKAPKAAKKASSA